MSPLLTIAQVSSETGIAKEVLRKWESRYGFPAPIRDGNGNRVYPVDQLERLKLIKKRLDDGGRPSHIVPAPPSVLQMEAPPVMEQPAHLDSAPDALPSIVNWLRLRDPAAVRENLKGELQQRGLLSFVKEVIPAMNRQVGDAWESGIVAVRDEHLYSEIVQGLVRESLAPLAQPQGEPRILLTTVPGEPHMLGLLLLETVMSLEQAYCISLGPQSPLEEIARAASDFKVNIVALSFSLAFPKKRIIPTLRAVRAQLSPEIKLWAGGAGVLGVPRTPRGVSLLPRLEDALEALASYRQLSASAVR